MLGTVARSWLCRRLKRQLRSKNLGSMGKVGETNHEFFIVKSRYFCKNYNNMKGQNRSDVKVGKEVGIVLKEDQSSGKITEGTVQDILTKSLFHPHGIKVRLTSGEVGRVKVIK